MMASIRIAIVALLALALAGGCAKPDFRLANGSDGRFADYEGQWLIVNYWAEWCAPCRKEIPELNELDAAGTAAVLGVNFDGLGGEMLRASMETMGIAFNVMEGDPSPHWDQPRPKVLPTSFIIAPDGTLSEVLVGPQTQEDFTLAVGAELQEAFAPPDDGSVQGQAAEAVGG